MEELGKLAESEDVSFETKIRIIHASVSPATMYWCKSGTVKKVDRKLIDSFERTVLEESSTGALDDQKEDQGLRTTETETLLEAQMTKLELCSP